MIDQPTISEDELAELTFRAAERRQWLEVERTLKEWNGRSLSGIRRARMPDGTHLGYRVPTVAFHFWGHKLGYDCWEDDQFVHEFLRDNPQCRVHSEAVNPMISVGRALNRPAEKYQDIKKGRQALVNTCNEKGEVVLK